MLQKIERHIARHKLFTSRDRVLLAVSGGIDSMVMLHVMRSMGVTLGVAHCNFQLRGIEADRDEEFVRSICQQHEIPFFFKRFETNNYAIGQGLSIQMAARQLRYDWFDQLLSEHAFALLATAHHRNDAIETSLLNFSRGTTARGIAGIAPQNGKRIRPMLAVTRQEIEDYAATHQIVWREDESNNTTDYTRNFIRKLVVPKLLQINPSLPDTFSDFTERMSGTNELASRAVSDWKARFWTERDERVVVRKSGLAEFQQAASVLYELIKDLGFNLTQCREMVEALQGQSGKRFFSHTHELVIDREELVISILSADVADLVLTNERGTYQRKSQMLTLEVTRELHFTIEPTKAFLDLDKIQWPLVWRTWKTGDQFQPLGMQHRKKVSDFLIDQKISLAAKTDVTVLEANGEIVWLVGYRIDDRVKVTEHSKAILVVSLTSSY